MFAEHKHHHAYIIRSRGILMQDFIFNFTLRIGCTFAFAKNVLARLKVWQQQLPYVYVGLILVFYDLS